MGSKKKVTIGYRYYLGFHAGIGRGPVNELVEIEVGGKKAWQGSVTGNTAITIAQPGLFGGDKKEGGIDGALQVLMGDQSQTAPAGLASMLGGDVPGFRGFMSVYYDGMVSAMNPYIKPWKFRVRRSTAGWDGEAWYPTRAKIELSAGAIHAMNPAHIVYECLTNRDWGGGMDRSRLDDASFRAAADALYAEGFGLCLRWNRGDAVSDFVQEVLDHIGGNLYLSRFDGLFHLTLIRDDYDAASLPLFDEDSGLLGVDEDDNSASAGALNEIVVKWHDPISNESRSWRERNLGAVRADGKVLSESKSYAGLPTAELAGRVAVRELRAASAGLKRFKVRLERRGYRIEPGQPFRIRSLKRGIESMVVRAGRIEDGRLDDATITITAVQDVFGLPASSMTAVQPSGWTPPDATPQAIGVRRLLERTWRDIAQDTDPANLELIDPTACYLQALAVKPTALSQGYAMQVRVGSSEWTEADDGGDFCPSGLLVAALGPADTAFTLTSGSDLDFVTPGGAALIGDEIVRVDSFDYATLSGTLGRGCVDTVPASHAAGARMWFVEDAGALDAAAYSPGTTVQARLLTQTSQGQLDPALAATDSLTLLGRQGRPYPPGQLRINGESYPASVTGDVVLSWAHRDRVMQADQLIDHSVGNIGPESGVTYNLNVYGESGLRIKTLTGLTSTSWTWPSADEMSESGLILNVDLADLHNAVLADAPYAYYQLDAGSTGQAAADSSGNGRDGEWQFGAAGGARHMGVVGGRFALGGQRVVLPAMSPDWAAGISVFALWNPAGLHNWERVIDLSNGMASDNILLARNGSSNQLSFGIWSGSSLGTAINGGVITAGRWQLVGVTVDAQRLAKLWLNGEVVAEQAISMLPNNVTRSSNMIAWSPWNEQTDARIAAVSVFDRGLSDARAQAYWDAVKDQLNKGRLNNQLRFELWSSRAGLESLQRYDVSVSRPL